MVEYTRMVSGDATRMRVEDADHRNHDIELARSGGRVTTRVVSRERVLRMVSFEVRMVAMDEPSGLGIV